MYMYNWLQSYLKFCAHIFPVYNLNLKLHVTNQLDNWMVSHWKQTLYMEGGGVEYISGLLNFIQLLYKCGVRTKTERERERERERCTSCSSFEYHHLSPRLINALIVILSPSWWRGERCVISHGFRPCLNTVFTLKFSLIKIFFKCQFQIETDHDKCIY